MRPFEYGSALDASDACSKGTDRSSFIAGGTTLIDLMKLEVMNPSRLVDLNSLPMRGITIDDKELRIGALEKMSAVAADPIVATNYPVISEALLQSASPQIRNMASIGGNLLQRTRCGYFRDTSTPCNKREPGTGCSAINGENRMHAILGTSESCVATHPSDLAVALVALDASIRLQGAQGYRLLKLEDFYLLPGQTPDKENQLQPGEIITEIAVPRLPVARKSTYVKVRDRASYEFALTSAAVGLELDSATIRDARVAVGGVGTRPWNLPGVRQALIGKQLGEEVFRSAAELAVGGARPLRDNGFKIHLLQSTIVRALMNLGGLA
jgi:xanthine dehydrogenase YagS FAD-binding subunit